MSVKLWIVMISSLVFISGSARSGTKEKLLGVASSVVNSQEMAESPSFYDLGFYFDLTGERKADFFCRMDLKNEGWISGFSAFNKMELLLGFEKFTPETVWFEPVSRKLMMTGGHHQVRFILQGLIYCRDQNFVGIGGELELVRSSGSERMMVHLSRNVKK